MLPIKLERLQRLEQDGRGRWRLTPDGRWLPSSTTILSGAMAQGWAKNWAAKVERELVCSTAGTLFQQVNGQRLRPESFSKTLELRVGKPYAYERVSRAALNIGTEAHKMIEWTVRRELGDSFTPQPAISNPARMAFTAWENWKQGSGLVSLAAESDVYHGDVGYTGGLDYMAGRGESVIVTDWKTGKIIDGQAHLQLASYVVAARWLGIPVVAGYIIQLPKVESDPNFKVIELGHMAGGRIYTIEELFEVFCHVKQVWDWIHHTDRPALTGRTAKKHATAAGNGAEESANEPGDKAVLPAASMGKA